jgi:hypothetical protein
VVERELVKFPAEGPRTDHLGVFLALVTIGRCSVQQSTTTVPQPVPINGYGVELAPVSQ